jgi:hypothetical protein
MNTREVERLLEKFFNGETSLVEETRLQAYFRQTDLPVHHQSLKAQFDFFADEANNALPVTDFEDQLFSHIQKNSKLKAQRKRRLWVIGFSGIAACLLLAVGLFMQYKPAPIEDSFNDPALAYQEIQKALFFVSEKLNMGIKPTQKATSDLNEGLEQASRISKLYEVQNFFIIE